MPSYILQSSGGKRNVIAKWRMWTRMLTVPYVLVQQPGKNRTQWQWLLFEQCVLLETGVQSDGAWVSCVELSWAFCFTALTVRTVTSSLWECADMLWETELTSARFGIVQSLVTSVANNGREWFPDTEGSAMNKDLLDVQVHRLNPGCVETVETSQQNRETAGDDCSSDCKRSRVRRQASHACAADCGQCSGCSEN